MARKSNIKKNRSKNFNNQKTNSKIPPVGKNFNIFKMTLTHWIGIIGLALTLCIFIIDKLLLREKKQKPVVELKSLKIQFNNQLNRMDFIYELNNHGEGVLIIDSVGLTYSISNNDKTAINQIKEMEQGMPIYNMNVTLSSKKTGPFNVSLPGNGSLPAYDKELLTTYKCDMYIHYKAFYHDFNTNRKYTYNVIFKFIDERPDRNGSYNPDRITIFNNSNLGT